MADDLIHCPSCGFQLRLPTDLYGTAVECPLCHSRFTAPAPTVRAAADRSPPGREYNAIARPADDYDFTPPARNAVFAPALALLITAVLAAGFSGYATLGWLVLQNDQARFDELVDRAIDRNPQIGPNDRAHMRNLMSEIREYAPAVCGSLFGLNLLTVLAAVLMLTRRGYVLAIIGCVLALNPVNLPGCLLLVPFGIWGLIALLSEPGRRAFR